MIVYVLNNPAMPGLVKIGRTDNSDANSRIGQLYTTGVPVPFMIEYACKVENPDQVEKALHVAFAPQRINPKREFFQIDPGQAIAILRLLNTEDATAEVSGQNSGVDPESAQAAVAFKAKRPNMNFTEMGIPEGSVLHSVEDDSTATVVSPRKVRFKDEEMSLTAATRIILGIEHSVQPSPYWTFNGRSLLDIYNETYTT
jgi:hypothetical protein